MELSARRLAEEKRYEDVRWLKALTAHNGHEFDKLKEMIKTES